MATVYTHAQQTRFMPGRLSGAPIDRVMRGGHNLKPAAIRELEGGRTISHRRQPVEATIGSPVDTVLGDSLDAPDHLPVEVIEVWNEIVPTLVEVGLARTVDVFMLEALCTHVAIARAAMTKIAGDGGTLDVEALVARTSKGVPVVSPWHRIFRDAWRDALKIAEHYGLTPTARTRLGIAALQQKSLAEQLRSIMDTTPDAIDGEAVEGVGVFDAPTCLGCGVVKGRKHGPGCERPGFSSMKSLDPGEVVAGPIMGGD